MKNHRYMFVSKSVRDNGKVKRINVECLGSIESIMESKGFSKEDNAIAWGKQYVEDLNKKLKTENEEITVKYFPNRIREIGDRAKRCKLGYLILQKIYYTFGMNLICDSIQKKYKAQYNLNTIMESLIYARMISPASKFRTSEDVADYYGWNALEVHQVYRSLSIFAKEMDYIQSQLFENSLKIMKRDTTVLYYDCSNFYFETEQSEGLKQYGYSKEHRPNPIVQIGLFMDKTGYPLGFCVHEGNKSETQTMIPLEKRILAEHNLQDIIVCTDAAMAIASNKIFNSAGGKHFVTTQPIKKLSDTYKQWAVEPDGWIRYIPKKEKETEEQKWCRRDTVASNKLYNINEIDEEAETDTIFFKKIGFLQEVKEDNKKYIVEQMLYVTYSVKYKRYCRMKRAEHIEMAKCAIKRGDKIDSRNNRDYKRLIGRNSYTKTGEKAETTEYFINQDIIAEEEKYDGFYGVSTDLGNKVSTVLTVLKNKWEIEESFRIMKTDFEARPIYVSRDERIKAHLLTCYLALFIYRVLEKHYLAVDTDTEDEENGDGNLNNGKKKQDKAGLHYTTEQIMKAIRGMDGAIVQNCISGESGISPLFEYSKCCHDLFSQTGVMLNKEFLRDKELARIIKENKKTPEKVERLFNPNKRPVGRPSKGSVTANKQADQNNKKRINSKSNTEQHR